MRLLNIISHAVAIVCTFLLTLASPVRADFLNLTGAETAPNIAEITVLDDRVNVRLEVFVEDLESFGDLIPADWLKDEADERPSEGERLEHFYKEVFSILGPDDKPLPAALKLVEPRLRIDRKSPFAGMTNPQTRMPVPEAPADKRVLFAEIDYLFDGKPDFLTIVPPLDEDGDVIVTVGFIAYHKTVPIIDFRYLSKPARLNLDWDDPWYSQFDNRNLKRHHQNPLMSFLYVEPRQVRHEILVRVRDLQDWTDLGLNSDTTLDPQEQEALRRRALAFFAGHNPVQIDGAVSEPTASRAEFLNISVGGLQVIEESGPLDLSTAIIGMSQSYPVDHLPQRVSVEWELFNERTGRIPAMAVDPAGPLTDYVDAENPRIEWQNFLKTYVEPRVAPVPVASGWRSFSVPGLSLVLLVIAFFTAALTAWPRYLSRIVWAGVSLACVIAAVLSAGVGIVRVHNPLAGPPDETRSAEIVDAVLGNVHTAYLERADPELERALGAVVAEDGFVDVKSELSRALAIKVAGGGIAQVNAIEDLVVQDISSLENGAGFRSVAEWTALASAGHWGHPHRRRIRFRALMELGEVEGTWKLIGLTVVDARDVS